MLFPTFTWLFVNKCIPLQISTCSQYVKFTCVNICPLHASIFFIFHFPLKVTWSTDWLFHALAKMIGNFTTQKAGCKSKQDINNKITLKLIRLWSYKKTLVFRRRHYWQYGRLRFYSIKEMGQQNKQIRRHFCWQNAECKMRK